jgi:16S rRNA (uracil1498-N3)-methyltransferase
LRAVVTARYTFARDEDDPTMIMTMTSGLDEDLAPEFHPITYPATLAIDQTVELRGVAVRGLRLRQVNAKEAFTMRDADGNYFRAALRVIDGDVAEALVYERMPVAPESPARITLVCAVLARQRMLVVMQKATELGVTRIVPTLSERSVQREDLAHEKAHAWPGQVIRAVRQCRRGSVPVVTRAEPLDAVLASNAWRRAAQRFYLDDRAAKNSGRVSLPGAVRERGTTIDVAVAIGPEGGFTDSERRRLADEGGTPLALGGRVLRAETAVFVGLTLLQHRLGDLAID